MLLKCLKACIYKFNQEGIFIYLYKKAITKRIVDFVKRLKNPIRHVGMKHILLSFSYLR